MTNTSPINIVKQFMKQQGNPKELLLAFMQQNNQNTGNNTINNLIQMAQKGDYKQVENFAVNAFKEQGRDFYKEFAQFKKFLNS